MKILICGDFAPKARLEEQINAKKNGTVFTEEIREMVRSADFSFVNMECPVTEEGFKPISKCGPHLHCGPQAIEAISYAGFTGVTMANNHILDFGAEGLQKTIECCRVYGVETVGVGHDLEESGRPLTLEKNGEKLSIINCCEHEFSIATDHKAGANPLDPIRQYYAIKEAKKKSDFVLVIVHGGHEMFQFPSHRMMETYRFFIEAGADAVVNHHQHCYSGYEIYKERPIFYGLGNFCFDWEGRNSGIWTEGFCVSITFSSPNCTPTFNLHPYTQYAETPTILLKKGDSLRDFETSINRINSIIASPKDLAERIDQYYSECSKYEIDRLEPYSKTWQNYLFSKGLLPKTMGKSKCLMLLGHITCESHLDKLKYALKAKL